MEKISLLSLLKVFAKLGLVSFGGPVAHIALMDRELVTERGWITRERFLHLHALTQLIPGPNSTELAMIIGKELRGRRGLILASIGFIGPAFLSSCALAWAYQKAGHLPIGQEIFQHVRPLILIIVARALYGFIKQLPRRPLWILGSLALLAQLAGLPDLLILLLGGLAMLAAIKRQHLQNAWIYASAPASVVPASTAIVPTEPIASLDQIFLVFFKIGAVLFGSGYTLLLYLKDDLVHRLGWLTESQVLDAITVGQMTPGPLFSSASFIGFLLHGWVGAGLATLGIFGPGFIMIASSGYLMPRLERRPEVPHVLQGVNAAAMGLMAHVVFDLAKSSLVDGFSLILAGAAFFLLEKARMDAGLLIVCGIAVGCISYFV